MNCCDLLAKARRSSSNLTFREGLLLAECLGFVLARTRGSHFIFKHAGYRRIVNLQASSGRAKPYQIRPLLFIADELEGEEEGE